MADNTTIKIKQGHLRGKVVNSVRSDVKYYSFQGIPYGKPPVNELRFKPPQPAESWDGVREATKEGPSSLSMHMISKEYLDTSSEDCLYINVYTTDTKGELPVMVWIHGGGFAMGSGDTDVYGPDYLITEDIVLVTLNYRLGPLGFLSLQTPECPGNYGLKDMVLALKWVQDNISSFGGDKNKVTIFGESAGGAAVNYLMLSPSSKGLFHQAISQSGSVLNPWAFAEDPKPSAMLLAKRLGCDATDSEELYQFFKTASGVDLVKKSSANPNLNSIEDVLLSFAFGPCVEPKSSEGAFLTDTPANIIARGEFHDVPYICGTVSLEGLIVYSAFNIENIPGGLDVKIGACLPHSWNIPPMTDLSKEVVRRIKEHYFPNGDDKKIFVDILSHLYFINGIRQNTDGCASSSARTSPTYCYNFVFDGHKTMFKNVLGQPDMPGVSHGDDLCYLFHNNMANAKLEVNTKDYDVVKTVTKIWTDFAKYGNPTPEANCGVTWPAYTKQNSKYLEINDGLTVRDDYYQEDKEFWDNLHKFIEQSK